MALYSQNTINIHLNAGNNGAATTAVRGRAFEDLACYLFGRIPGVEITQRNQLNAFNTEEIDVAIWNKKRPLGLYFLPHIVLIECKNWSHPVSSSEVNWFASKLESRGMEYGVLIANNGITGDANDLTAAHRIVAQQLERGRRLIIIDRLEIMQLQETKDIIKLIQKKLCTLTVSGAIG